MAQCDDGGILWVFSNCGTSVGFHTRYDGELREPLMWCQGSQVSMRMARVRLERGPGIALQAMQEKKALISRCRGSLVGFLRLLRSWSPLAMHMET